VGLGVKTYLEDNPDDAVNLNAQFGSLDDGTTYPKTITLNAPSKNLEVQVTNSGYRKSN